MGWGLSDQQVRMATVKRRGGTLETLLKCLASSKIKAEHKALAMGIIALCCHSSSAKRLFKINDEEHQEVATRVEIKR